MSYQDFLKENLDVSKNFTHPNIQLKGTANNSPEIETFSYGKDMPKFNVSQDEATEVFEVIETESKVQKNSSHDIEDGYLEGAEVVEIETVSEEQQDTIDSCISMLIESTPGETQSAKQYKDENGNITKEVMTKKTEDGTTYTIEIHYDEKGRVDFVQKYDPGVTLGKSDMYDFEYNEDGTITMQQTQGARRDGLQKSSFMYIPQLIIGQDGKCYQILQNGRRNEVPPEIFFKQS